MKINSKRRQGRQEQTGKRVKLTRKAGQFQHIVGKAENLGRDNWRAGKAKPAAAISSEGIPFRRTSEKA
jgi:hypothetical protein